jgi:hypothetical protein
MSEGELVSLNPNPSLLSTMPVAQTTTLLEDRSSVVENKCSSSVNCQSSFKITCWTLHL